MTGRKNAGALIGLVLAFSLIASAVTALFMAEFNNRMHFQLIGHLFRTDRGAAGHGTDGAECFKRVQ